MAAIFLIIMIVFKSISLPVILVSVIEFAIAVNMAQVLKYFAAIPVLKKVYCISHCRFKFSVEE